MNPEKGRIKIAAAVLALVVIVAVIAVVAMPRDVTVVKEGEGTLSFEGDKSLRAFGSIDIDIEPADGYRAVVYLDGDETASDVTSYKYSAPFADFSKHEVKVVFERVAPAPSEKVSLIVEANEGGKVDPAGTTEYSKGTTVAISIEAEKGYVIDDVKVDGESVKISNTIDVKMDADRKVSVSFVKEDETHHTVSISANARVEVKTTGGEIDFGSVVPSGIVKVKPGSSLKISVMLKDGFEVEDFVVDGKSVGKTTTYTIEDIRKSMDVSISVVQNVDGFVIKASAGNGGKITPSGDVKVEKGKDATFKFDANSGYAVKEVTVDGKKVTASGSYTFKAVSENHTIAVTFKYVGSGSSGGSSGSSGGSVTPPVTLNEIKVTTPPEKVVYQVEEKFDPKGMVVKAIYSNGSTKVLKDEEYNITPESLATSTKSITISYNGKTCAQEVLVVNENTIIVEDADGLMKVGNGLASSKTQKDYNRKTILITKTIKMGDEDVWPVIKIEHPLEYLTIKGYGDGIKISNLHLGNQSSDIGFIASTFSMETLVIEGITFDGLKTGDVPDASNAVGAFIGFAGTSKDITISNCNVTNSTISGGHWAGGLVGYGGGYSNQNNGAVFETLTLDNCAVYKTTITSKGSAGGLIGHATGDYWTRGVFTECSVTECTIASTGSSEIKAGSLMGTLGTGLTMDGHEGGVFITSCTVDDKTTATSSGITIDRICGRQGSPGGVLNVDGKYLAFWYDDGKTEIKPIESIKITTPPTKTIYKAGESFEPNGMVVTAVYSDKSERNLGTLDGGKSSEYFLSPTKITADTKQIMISFGGMECYQGIAVLDNVDSVMKITTEDELITMANDLTDEEKQKNYFEGKTILIMNDLDMIGKSWPAIKLNAIENLTFKGFGKGITISNLALAQFTNTNDNKDDANGSTGFISFTYSMTNLTFEGITFDKLTTEDASGNGIADNENGVGAFIGKATTVADIAISDCHVTNSKISGGHWTGGFVGYATGYSGTDSPVFETLTIENSTVENTKISSPGSAGGLIGHATGDAWTRDEFKDCEVKGCIITSEKKSNGDFKAGSLIGTVGGGQTKNDKNGGVFVTDCTAEENIVKCEGDDVKQIYGRQGSAGGILCVDDKLYVFSAADFNKLTQEEYDSELIGKKLDAIVLVSVGEWGLSSSSLKNITYEIAGGVDVTLTIPQNAGWTYRFDGDGYTGYAKMLNSNQVANGYFEVETADGFRYINEKSDEIFKNIKGIMPGDKGETYTNEWSVKLVADLDFKNETMNTIDFKYDSLFGNGHTVRNATFDAIKISSNGYGGFISEVDEMKDINFDNIRINYDIQDSDSVKIRYVGIAAGHITAGNTTNNTQGVAEDIHVRNSSIGIGDDINKCYAGGLFGISHADIKNCSVENVEIHGGKSVGSMAGLIANENSNKTMEISGNEVSNVTITANEQAVTTNAFSGRLLAAGGDITVSDTTISNITVNSVVYGQDDLDNVVLPVPSQTKTPYGQLYLQDSGSITIDGESAFSPVKKPTT